MSGLGQAPLLPGSITSDLLADLSVTTNKIAFSAVGSGKMQPAGVRDAIGNMVTTGAIGSYGFFRCSVIANPGDLVSGADLKFGSLTAGGQDIDYVTVVSGTWEVCGIVDSLATPRFTVCKRVS